MPWIPKNRDCFGPIEGRVMVCQCLLYCLHRGSLCTGVLPVEIVPDEDKRLYSTACKVLWVRCNERQVTLCKWEEQPSGSSIGKWTLLLIHNFRLWLERGHRYMDFYLSQIMFGHATFNAYLFRMKLVESPKCANGDRRRRDDAAWYIPFGCQGSSAVRRTWWPPYKRWVRSLLHQTVWSQSCYGTPKDGTRVPRLSLW